MKPLLKVVMCSFALLIWINPLAQQTNDMRFSFVATDEPLSLVLDRLSQSASVNFTYNSADSSFAKPITYTASNKTVQQILADILNLSGHNVRRIGNQLVVFPNEVISTVIDSPDEFHIEAIAVDTTQLQNNIVRDTVFRYETITKLDTLIIRDTVFIEKEVYRDSRRPDLKRITEDIFRFEPNRKDGWALAFNYGQYYGNFNSSANQNASELHTLVKSTESSSFRNFSLGSELLLNKNKWTFTAGIQLTGFANRLKHKDVQSSGGFYRMDTISWYYTVVQLDTTWFPVTDSTYLPLDRREENYNQLNRFGYIDFLLGAAYNFYSDDKLSLYLKANLGNSLLIYRNGVLLQQAPNFPGVEYDQQDFNNSLFFYQLGAGLRYKAGDWFDLFGELSTRSYFGTVLKDYPVEKRYYMIGLKAGLIYYF